MTQAKSEDYILDARSKEIWRLCGKIGRLMEHKSSILFVVNVFVLGGKKQITKSRFYKYVDVFVQLISPFFSSSSFSLFKTF